MRLPCSATRTKKDLRVSGSKVFLGPCTILSAEQCSKRFSELISLLGIIGIFHHIQCPAVDSDNCTYYLPAEIMRHQTERSKSSVCRFFFIVCHSQHHHSFLVIMQNRVVCIETVNDGFELSGDIIYPYPQKIRRTLDSY